jgi:repressor LexA
MGRAMESLTDNQRKVLKALVTGVVLNGYQPSLRELAKTLRYSHPSALMCHLKALRNKGYLKPSKVQSRAIKIDWQKLGLSRETMRKSAKRAREIVGGLP